MQLSRQEFSVKYGEFSDVTNSEILMRIQSNLSDLHIETQSKNHASLKKQQVIDDKLNAMKAYIADFDSVLKTEAQTQQ